MKYLLFRPNDYLKKKLKEFNIIKQLSSNFIFKLISAFLGFFIISFSLHLIGEKNYGLWMTIFTMINWFTIFDLGIGGGLRNELGKSIANNSVLNGKKAISTSLILIFEAILLIGFIFFSLYYIIDWQILFNTNIPKSELLKTLVNVFLTFIVLLISKLNNSLLNALHKSELVTLNFLLYQIILILTLLIYSSSLGFKIFSILEYSRIVLLSTVLTYFSFIFWTFFRYYRNFIPHFKYYDKKVRKRISKIGAKFFLIQISAIILYSTDLFFINRYVNNEEAALYSILQKYYGVLIIIFGLFIAPIWSIIVEAKEKKDFYFIKKIHSNLILLFTGVVIVGFIMFIFRNYIFLIWIPNFYSSAKDLLPNLLMLLYTLSICIMQIYSSIQNGLGDVKVQTIYAGIASILNLLITYYGLAIYGYGINWALFVSVLVNVPGIFIYRIYVMKQINK